MRTQSTIITTLALAATLAMPSSALASSPLLSGYGGPGAGEQQIVSGGLVGGGGKGGSNGGSHGGSAGGESAGGAGQGQPTGQSESTGGGFQAGQPQGRGQAATRAGEGAGDRSGTRSPGGSPGRGGVGAQHSDGSTQTQHPPETSAIRLASASSTLGLSGGEMLLMILIAIALIAIAALTWWLNRSRAGAHRSIEVP